MCDCKLPGISAENSILRRDNCSPPGLTSLSIFLPGLETALQSLLWSEVDAAAFPSLPPLPHHLRDGGDAAPPSAAL